MERLVRDWRPAALSDHIRRRPLRLALGGQDIVLFRARSGALGALPGRCLHRGTPLSEGKVVGDRLECPYHGWRYSVDGRVSISGGPDACLTATSYPVEERYGLVWIRGSGPGAPLPEIAPAGFQHVSTLHRTVAVPVELLLDNFTEVEHTAQVHCLFGYPKDRLGEVTFRSRVEDGKVYSSSSGPQKPLPPGAWTFLGIRAGDRFLLEWVTVGQPLHARYQLWWEDPGSGKVRGLRLFEVVYFASLGPRQSAVTALYFVEVRSAVPGLTAITRAILRGVVALEYRRDLRLLASLGSVDPSLRACRLGRFDSAINAQRELFFGDGAGSQREDP